MDLEKLGFPKVELSQQHTQLIDKLRLHEKSNSLVSKITKCVEHGFINEAKTLCFNEADKFRRTPEIIDILLEYLFDENEEVPWPSHKKSNPSLD